MKLVFQEFDLPWPQTVDKLMLRNHIINHLSKKGELIKWSINKIINNKDSNFQRILKISVLTIN